MRFRIFFQQENKLNSFSKPIQELGAIINIFMPKRQSVQLSKKQLLLESWLWLEVRFLYLQTSKNHTRMLPCHLDLNLMPWPFGTSCLSKDHRNHQWSTSGPSVKPSDVQAAGSRGTTTEAQQQDSASCSVCRWPISTGYQASFETSSSKAYLAAESHWQSSHKWSLGSGGCFMVGLSAWLVVVLVGPSWIADGRGEQQTCKVCTDNISTAQTLIIYKKTKLKNSKSSKPLDEGFWIFFDKKNKIKSKKTKFKTDST